MINKKSNHEFKKHIFYNQLEMASYLQEIDLWYSVRERQYLFQCRMNDIDVKANRSWKYEDLTCNFCNITNETETQEHILLCNALLKINTIVTYIPQYSDLYSDEIEEQMYKGFIICENMRLRDNLRQLMWSNSMVWSAAQQFWIWIIINYIVCFPKISKYLFVFIIIYQLFFLSAWMLWFLMYFDRSDIYSYPNFLVNGVTYQTFINLLW